MEIKLHDQEIILQKLWKSRKFMKQDLRTLSGKPVEVLYVGSENLDAGPDFKDAVVKIAGVLLKGDIEVHLNATGWYEHQHHLDSVYNSVILHLISEEPHKSLHIEREDGVRVEQLHIELDRESIDLWKKQNEQGSKSPQSGLIVENCPLSRASKSKILATVNAAGEVRWCNKTAQMREDLSRVSWDQLIYRRIMDALGYSKNRQPFRRLAELVPFEMLTAEMQWVPEHVAEQRCAALLFGASGLLPDTPGNGSTLDKEVMHYIAPLIELWQTMARRLELKQMRKREWQFFRLRPRNFPTRRLAGMVKLVLAFYHHGFLDGFLKLVHAHLDDIGLLRRELERAIVQETDGFWAEHYSFEAASGALLQKREHTLIGRERAQAVVTNTLLPILSVYAEEAKDGRLRNAVQELYARYPRISENEITKAMGRQLFGGYLKSKSPLEFAFQQQGLIHLHKLYCRPLKCSECLALANRIP